MSTSTRSRAIPARVIPKARKPLIVQRPHVSQEVRDLEAATLLAKEIEKMRFVNSVRSGCTPVYNGVRVHHNGRGIPVKQVHACTEQQIGGSMRMNKKTGKHHVGQSSKPVFRSMGQLLSITITH